MKKKKLSILVIFLSVAMLALPMSAVSATKPEKITLTGTHNPGAGTVRVILAGESGNLLMKLKDCEDTWTGGISGVATFSGSWLFDGLVPKTVVGYWIFEEVTILGRTGGLRIGANGDEVWIESGSGELKGVNGRGTTTTVVPMVSYNYEIELQYHP